MKPETRLSELFTEHFGEAVEEIQRLPLSGGNRAYYRIRGKNDQRAIGTVGNDQKENNAFFYWSKLLRENGIPVPEIFVEGSDGIYLQRDSGDHSLLDMVLKNGFGSQTVDYYKEALRSLAALQQIPTDQVDFTQTAGSEAFSKELILHDLLYFKFYFCDPLQISYDREKLLKEFDHLAETRAMPAYPGIMLRDFQARNILIENNRVTFIDYQAAMRGPVAYDVSSLLWQASAKMPDETKDNLLNTYLSHFPESAHERILSDYQNFLLLRLLQVLGAYGFRGLFERKEHFIQSIAPALINLNRFIDLHADTLSPYPELRRCVAAITEESFIAKFKKDSLKADASLTVHIKSFSFLKRGYPAAVEAHGGGYVFDCRGILNPGRVEEYKKQTGRDLPVQEYLTGKTRMDEFLENVYRVVDISVDDYLKRGFEHLDVNFGCTGGQHRSVYAADSLAKHLHNKYGVRTEVQHLEQNFEQL